MVVQRPGGRRTPVRVHRQVERAQQRAGQLTVVPTSVFFGRADDHHAAFDRRDVFLHPAENVMRVNYFSFFENDLVAKHTIVTSVKTLLLLFFSIHSRITFDVYNSTVTNTKLNYDRY